MTRRDMLKLGLISGGAMLLSPSKAAAAPVRWPTGGLFDELSPAIVDPFQDKLKETHFKTPLGRTPLDSLSKLEEKTNGGVLPNGTVYPQVKGDDALTTYRKSLERIVALQRRNSESNRQFRPQFFYVLKVKEARNAFHNRPPTDEEGAMPTAVDAVGQRGVASTRPFGTPLPELAPTELSPSSEAAASGGDVNLFHQPSLVDRPTREIRPPTPDVAPPSPLKPVYDAMLHELSLGNEIVKRFTRPAPAQELILAAFQEEGWPPAIDDPLPAQYNQDPTSSPLHRPQPQARPKTPPHPLLHQRQRRTHPLADRPPSARKERAPSAQSTLANG